MKKLRNLFMCGLVVVFTLSFFLVNQEAEAGSKRIIPTRCVVKSTGEVVGYSNNCGSGSGSCTDNDCSGTMNPSLSNSFTQQ